LIRWYSPNSIAFEGPIATKVKAIHYTVHGN
jgi:hypothetical protein